MTWRRDWLLALWAAKSFYYFSQVDWPIVIHEGGALNSRIACEFLRHFPNARLVRWDEATAVVEPRLLTAGYVHLAHARRTNVMIRKLIDFAVMATAPIITCMDSDVLFVNHPMELIRLSDSKLDRLWFNRDSHDMYSISQREAIEWFGLELPPQINAGLSLIPVSLVDLAFLDQIFAPNRIPVDKDVFPEQTACALLSARYGPGYLSKEYTVATGTPPLDLLSMGLVSRHYVGPVRYLLYDEGIPYLLKHTTLCQRSN